jgi:integrase
MQDKHKPSYTLLEYAEYFINKRRAEEGEKVIIKQTELAVIYLKEFLIKNKCTDIPLTDFNQGKLRDFETFMKNKKYGVHSKQFKTNTIHKYLSKIKAIFIYAIQQELILRNPFYGYRLRKEESDRAGLDYYYINKLMRLDLTDRPELEITRDCFLFCCFTGIRFDYSRKITQNNLYFDEQIGTYVLRRDKEINVNSNKKPANKIPLVDSALKIIEKYRDHPLTSGRDRLLPTVSNQKTNKKLKELQMMIGWHEESLTFHISRHTLSCSISNADGKDSDIIKDKIMGHKNNSMSARYSRNISNSTMLNRLREIEYLILNV